MMTVAQTVGFGQLSCNSTEFLAGADVTSSTLKADGLLRFP
jgi:hypothetical protein